MARPEIDETIRTDTSLALVHQAHADSPPRIVLRSTAQNAAGPTKLAAMPVKKFFTI
jgi:hypothetical protein